MVGAGRFIGGNRGQAGGAGGNPAAKERLLLDREWIVGGHFLAIHAIPKQALVRISGDDWRTVFAATRSPFGRAEVQTPLVSGRPMALHATCLQERQNVLLEARRLGGAGRGQSTG